MSMAVQVLVRGNLNAVRGKGNNAFLVLRQGTATAQVTLAPASPHRSDVLKTSEQGSQILI